MQHAQSSVLFTVQHCTAQATAPKKADTPVYCTVCTVGGGAIGRRIGTETASAFLLDRIRPRRFSTTPASWSMERGEPREPPGPFPAADNSSADSLPTHARVLEDLLPTRRPSRILYYPDTQKAGSTVPIILKRSDYGTELLIGSSSRQGAETSSVGARLPLRSLRNRAPAETPFDHGWGEHHP